MISDGLSLVTGLLLMTIVTAMWGISFLTPVILDDYTAIDITIGRYAFYGAVSLGFWLLRYRKVAIKPFMWITAFAYAVTGNIGFSLLVTYGIQEAGPIVAIPLIGLLPLSVAIFGNASLAELPWSRLVGPLSIIAVGLGIVLGIESGLFSAQSIAISPLGVLSILATVAMWTWYAIANARFLRRHKEIDSGAWSCLIGVATFAITLVWIIGTIGISAPDGSALVRLAERPDIVLFLCLTAFLGVFASWIAGWLFNLASLKLPMNWVGQLIALEIVFGILYVCLYENRLPPLLQIGGIISILAGIVLSLRTIKGKASR